MTFLKISRIWVALCSGILLGCSAVSQIGSGTIPGSTLSYVPKATGPVVSTSQSLSFTPMAATTGVVLANLGSYSWANRSKPFCQLSQMTRDTIRNGAQADKILCYISAGVNQGGVVPTSGNMYDGEFKYFNFAGGMAGAAIKMKVRRNSSGAIDLFQMHMCQSGSQSEYVSQSISNGNVTMTTKMIGSFSGNTFSSNVSVSGTINSNYQWTSKTITGSNYSNWNGGGYTSTYGNGITLVQGPSTVQLTGYQRGTFAYTNDGGTTYTMRDSFDMKFASVIQLLNASAMTTIGLGDGTAKADMSFSRDLNNDTDQADAGEFSFSSGAMTASWNGDTRQDLADATTGDHYAAANALTVGASAAPAAISWTGGESWNCTSVDNGQSFGSIDPSTFASGISACDTEFGGHDQDWVQCDMD